MFVHYNILSELITLIAKKNKIENKNFFNSEGMRHNLKL